MRHQILSMCLMLTLIGSSWCGWCTAQRDRLDELKIAYREIDVSSKEAQQLIRDFRLGGMVPVLVNGDRFHVGFLESEAALRDLSKDQS